jgi:hypothetical protein
MCDSLARFGGYDTLNVMMCPQIFSPAPQAGEMLPLNEIPGCFPSATAAKDGKIYSSPCEILVFQPKIGTTFSQHTSINAQKVTITIGFGIVRRIRRTDAESSVNWESLL